MTPNDIETAIGTLPDKLSDLLEVALDDFEKVAARPDVEISMGDWCCEVNRMCRVCLAGGVIANRIGVDTILMKRSGYLPSFFDNNTRRKLRALDCLRNGNIRGAAHYVGVEVPPDMRPYRVIRHADGSPGFIPEMRSLIHLLRTHEL